MQMVSMQMVTASPGGEEVGHDRRWLIIAHNHCAVIQAQPAAGAVPAATHVQPCE